MSAEWTPGEVPFKNTSAFEDLHPAVQKHIREARGWAMVDGGWEAIYFVDEPRGNHWSVRRSTDELGTEEIEVVEIRYVERRLCLEDRMALDAASDSEPYTNGDREEDTEVGVSRRDAEADFYTNDGR